eukprot:3338789-Rhodomonas_salina.3
MVAIDRAWLGDYLLDFFLRISPSEPHPKRQPPVIRQSTGKNNQPDHCRHTQADNHKQSVQIEANLALGSVALIFFQTLLQFVDGARVNRPHISLVYVHNFLQGRVPSISHPVRGRGVWFLAAASRCGLSYKGPNNLLSESFSKNESRNGVFPTRLGYFSVPASTASEKRRQNE